MYEKGLNALIELSVVSDSSYRPAESKENLIKCQPLTEGQTWKPKRLQQIEVDSLKLRAEGALEAHWTAGDKPGQVMM